MFRRGLSTLLDSPVKLDNHLVWDGKRFPFYEAYDFKIHHPRQGWSFFVRYALHYPTRDRREAKASLTSLFADQKGTNLRLEQGFPLAEHDVVHTDRFITVGDSSFSLAEALGCVVQNDQTLRWELNFEDPTQGEHLYPWFLRQLPIARIKFLSPRFLGFVSGQIFVNQRSRDFQHLKLFQSHRYGSRSTLPLTWIQCSDFEEDETAVFEVLAIERGWFRSSKKSKKRWNFFNLIYEGQKYSVHQLWKPGTLLGGEGETSLQFEKRGRRFECRVMRGTQNGGLSVLAAIQIKIYKKKMGGWAESGTLTSKTGGVLEECL